MKSKIKILHIDSNHPTLMQQLSHAGMENVEDYTSSKSEIEEKIHDFDGVVIRSRFDIDREFLDKATNLKFIARVGAGLESIDSDYAATKNITLIAAPEGNRNAVAEHTLAMLLALFNKINTADREIRTGQWNREKNRGHELDGKTVGIIGYGNMGKAFAKKLRGFEVNVVFYDILDNISDANAKQVSLAALQSIADVVSLHLPWTPQTNGMVNSDFINSFSKDFWLINTSRGKNVITSDLVAALQSGKILGAGLDVLEYEKSSFESMFSQDLPEPLYDLLQADNVILSPHIAGWTIESKERLASVIANKIIALFSDANVILPETQNRKMERVTGFGGIFFKSAQPKELIAWYGKHLGLDTNDYGATFSWKDDQGNNCTTQWSPFAADTDYFEPSKTEFMQNFRVHNLLALLENLKSEGVTIVGEPQHYNYGSFAWILDPDGNKIELWQPNDIVVL